MSVATKHRGQNFNLYRKVLIGNKYEEQARQLLIKNKNISNPSPSGLAKQIGAMFKTDFEIICKSVVVDSQDPDLWVEKLKK
jgi:hypothetical protein